MADHMGQPARQMQLIILDLYDTHMDYKKGISIYYIKNRWICSMMFFSVGMAAYAKGMQSFFFDIMAHKSELLILWMFLLYQQAERFSGTDLQRQFLHAITLNYKFQMKHFIQSQDTHSGQKYWH